MVSFVCFDWSGSLGTSIIVWAYFSLSKSHGLGDTPLARCSESESVEMPAGIVG